jgi:hypothetical protein
VKSPQFSLYLDLLPAVPSLSIVNNQLWSMQLEIPDSPNVVLRRDKAKVRGRAFSLTRRESYATRLVEESMEKIDEEDTIRAVAAARVRKNSTGSAGDRRKSLSPSSCSDDGLVTVKEEEEEGREGNEVEETDAPTEQASVSDSL